MKSDSKNEYKLVAPVIDRFLRFFDRRYLNPSGTTEKLNAAMEPLFKAFEELAPLKSNREAKSIWIQVPRGNISDYDSFEELKESGEAETYEEYEKLWKEDYPVEEKWYEVVIVEGKDRDGKIDFRAVGVDNKTIISAMLNKNGEESFSDDAACVLCKLIVPAVKKSMELLRNGKYNELVASSLPYQFKTGVIKRSILWKYDLEHKTFDFDSLDENKVSEFLSLIEQNKNDERHIGRIKSFTANDFFRACKLGYEACGYKTEGKTPADLYIEYADGRDEGLTGTGHGLNEGSGIDFDSPEEWNSWYFEERGGGHPWEVVRGGNSTHLDLFVRNDMNEIDFFLRIGKISKTEYQKRKQESGYYFEISGKHRPFEAVNFYISLKKAGLPIVLEDADEIVARFKGSDYIGIVPHSVIPKYCEEMFPSKFGKVIDFIHVYDEDLKKYGKEIIWIPELPAKLN